MKLFSSFQTAIYEICVHLQICKYNLLDLLYLVGILNRFNLTRIDKCIIYDSLVQGPSKKNLILKQSM